MLDSLKKIVDIIEKNSSDNGIDLINKVDSFYNSAWDKLIIIGAVAFGIVGILVPIVIQWYQNKTLKISEELLKKDIETQTLMMKSEILEELNITLEEKIKSFENKIDKLNASTNAKTFHLQGNSMIKENNFSEALSDYIIAAKNYLKCDDFNNLQTVLRAICQDCLISLSAEEIASIKISHNCDLEVLIENLNEKNEKGILSQSIKAIRVALNNLQKNKK